MRPALLVPLATLAFIGVGATAGDEDPSKNPPETPPPSQSARWSPTTRINSVLVTDSLNIVRLEVLRNDPVFNPAGCLHLDHIDIQLDAKDRSAEEQRQMLNAVNMAFITRRPVSFYVLDDATNPASCSTVGTSGSIRIAVGVDVRY